MPLSKDLGDPSDELRCLTNGFLWEQFQQFFKFPRSGSDKPALTTGEGMRVASNKDRPQVLRLSIDADPVDDGLIIHRLHPLHHLRNRDAEDRWGRRRNRRGPLASCCHRAIVVAF